MTVANSEAILNYVVMYLKKNNYIDAIKSGFLLIFSATFLAALFQQFLDRKIEKIIQSPTGLNSMIWIWGILSLLAALVFPLVQTLLCSFYLSKNFSNKKTEPEDLKLFFSENFELSFIEMLRSWGKSFLWFFVFIVPGFVKYSYYMFSPFIVLFSDRYKKGTEDALVVSEQFFKKYWIYATVQLTIFYFIMPLVLSTLLDEYRSFYIHPVTATLCLVFESFMILLFHLLILDRIFTFLNNEKDLYADV